MDPRSAKSRPRKHGPGLQKADPASKTGTCKHKSKTLTSNEGLLLSFMNKFLQGYRKRVMQVAGKKYFYPAAAFVLPLLVMIATFAAMEVWPFGDHAAAIIDSYHQYVPFISELHDKLRSGDSLFYSWNGGLGFNFWAVMAYYLASPLNLLIIFFPRGSELEMFEFLIMLKIALSALTAAWYLKCRSGKWTIAAVLFAQFYALGAFTAAYAWCHMWLDCLLLFPLVVRGAERLLDEGDGRLYVIALGLTVFSNYYIAIMVLLFLVLYFFVYWFQKKRPGFKGFLRRGIHYAVASVVSVGIGAVYLLPTWYVMQNSSQGSPPSEWKLYRNFLDVFKQHFMMLEPTELEGAPNIYCGILIALLVIFYLLAREIPRRERISRLVLSTFLLVSLNINYFDYVWHGLHFPNNLPGRFSFLYIFMMVVMAYDAFMLLGFAGMRRHAAVGIGAAVLFAACLLFGKEEVELYTSLTTGLVMAGYLLFLFLQRMGISLKKKRIQVQPMHLILLLMTAELIANTIFSFSMDGRITRSLYLEDDADMRLYREEYASDQKPYRTEVGQTKGRDDITRYHLKGLSYFSSTCDDRLEDLVDALGFYKAGNKFTYEGATPLTDALLGIRYVASKSELSAYNLQKVDVIGEENIYENRRELPIGFLVKEDVLDLGVISGDPFMIQNDFAALASGTDKKIFTYLETPQPEISSGEFTSSEDCRWWYSDADSGEITFHLTFWETQDVYAYFEASHCTKLEVEAYGETTSYSDEKGHIVHIGICGEGTEVTLTMPLDEEYSSGNVRLRLAAFNEKAFEDCYDVFSASRYNVSSYDSTHISGTMNVAEDGILMFSIPFDEGWAITVDGVRAEQFPVGGALGGVRVSAGEHEITMRYLPPGFLPGLAITAAGVLLWLVYCYYIGKKRKEREAYAQRKIKEREEFMQQKIRELTGEENGDSTDL